MKSVVCASTLVCVLLPGVSKADNCLDWSIETTIQGVIAIEEYPGPPNFEDVETGDQALKAQVIRPTKPICIREGNDADGMEPALADITEIQIYGAHQTTLEGEAEVTGRLGIAENGYHLKQVQLYATDDPEPRQVLTSGNAQPERYDILGLYPGMTLKATIPIMNGFMASNPQADGREVKVFHDRFRDIAPYVWFAVTGNYNNKEWARGVPSNTVSVFFSGVSDGNRLLGVHRLLGFEANSYPAYDDMVKSLTDKYGEVDLRERIGDSHNYDLWWFRGASARTNKKECAESYSWIDIQDWYEGRKEWGGSKLRPNSDALLKALYNRLSWQEGCGTVINANLQLNDKETIVQGGSYTIMDHDLVAKAKKTMQDAKDRPRAAAPKL